MPWLWNRPPNDRHYYPLYVKCIELDIPFCTQVGQTGPLMPSEPGRPIPYLDEVALTFPELRIVAGHIGYPWTDEMLGLATKHENVFIDTSAHLPRYYPPQLVHFMRTYGRSKVLFGTNFPHLSFQKCVEQAMALDLPEDVARAFFTDNARRVFNLGRRRDRAATIEHALRWCAHVPHQSEPAQDFDAVVAEIDLPPEEALVRGGLVVVVVVVPVLAERHEHERPVVAAGVWRQVTAPSPDVHQRVHRETAVPEKHCRKKEAPEESDPTEGEPQSDSEKDRRQQGVLVQPAQLRVLREVLDDVEVCRVVLLTEYPSDVRPPEAALRGRVHVQLSIRVPMVVAMVTGPPERPFLRRRRREKGEQKLPDSARPECAVSEVAVIADCQAEHSYVVHAGTEHEASPGDTDPKHSGDRHHVDQRERDDVRPMNALVFWNDAGAPGPRE